jgi:hypothetical protein
MGAMSIAHGTARANAPRSQYAGLNATSAEHGPSVAEADPYSLDQLKFRIEIRKGRHYFRNVRFNGEAGACVLAGFLEGRALEDLTPVLLRSSFASSPILPRLQHLVRDLQRVFCE